MNAKRIFNLVLSIILAFIALGGFAFLAEGKRGKDEAESILAVLITTTSSELSRVFEKNIEVARSLERNSEFKKAISYKERSRLDEAMKAVLARSGFGGYGTIIDLKDGTITYSTDTADKDQYPAREFNKPLVQRAFSYGTSNALTTLSENHIPTLSSVIPLLIDGRPVAAVAVSTPFTENLLEKMRQKMLASNAKLKDLGMVFYVLDGSRITASSPNLQSISPEPSFLRNLIRAKQAPFALGTESIEQDGRLWKNMPVMGPDGARVMGEIIICIPLRNPWEKVSSHFN